MQYHPKWGRDGRLTGNQQVEVEATEREGGKEADMHSFTRIQKQLPLPPRTDTGQFVAGGGKEQVRKGAY